MDVIDFTIKESPAKKACVEDSNNDENVAQQTSEEHLL
jgi:hypothetical protein